MRPRGPPSIRSALLSAGCSGRAQAKNYSANKRRLVIHIVQVLGVLCLAIAAATAATLARARILSLGLLFLLLLLQPHNPAP